MGRLVTPKARPHLTHATGVAPAEARAAETPDGFLDRVAKYIPAEIIGAYLAVEKILDTGSEDRVLAIVTLILFALLTPLYFRMLPGDEHCKRLHMIVSTLAFLVWSYALPGAAWVLLGLENAKLAAVLLVVSSLLFGLIQPSPSEDATDETSEESPSSPREPGSSPR